MSVCLADELAFDKVPGVKKIMTEPHVFNDPATVFRTREGSQEIQGMRATRDLDFGCKSQLVMTSLIRQSDSSIVCVCTTCQVR